MSEEKKDSKLQRGVLVEFDFAVMPGHQVMLDVCKEQLSKEGLKIDEILMARYMFGRSFVAGLSALCRAQEISSFEVSDMAAAVMRFSQSALRQSSRIFRRDLRILLMLLQQRD